MKMTQHKAIWIMLGLGFAAGLWHTYMAVSNRTLIRELIAIRITPEMSEVVTLLEELGSNVTELRKAVDRKAAAVQNLQQEQGVKMK